MAYRIGIDIGGASAKLGLVSDEGAMLARSSIDLGGASAKLGLVSDEGTILARSSIRTGPIPLRFSPPE